MQLREFYTLLSIAAAATYVTGKEEKQTLALRENEIRKLHKREAAILLDNLSNESLYNHNAKVIFRRLSRQRYGPPKTKYGNPRLKHEPPKSRDAKKYRKPHPKSKFPPKKKRTQKPRHGPTKRPIKKPSSYGIPRKPPMPKYNTPQPTGFGEPPIAPIDYETYQQPQNLKFAEPPVDSYGAPLQIPKDTYPSAPTYYESNQFNQNYQPIRDANLDNIYEYTKNRPLFVKPDELFDAKLNANEENFDANTYLDLYSPHSYKESQYLHNRKKKPQYFPEPNIKVNRYWKAPKKWTDFKGNSEKDIVVGGLYAEPPARYVPKFQPSAPMTNDDDDFVPMQKFELDTATSASPYDNYKNSNMAFSPQNLNDVFSIVDK